MTVVYVGAIEKEKALIKVGFEIHKDFQECQVTVEVQGMSEADARLTALKYILSKLDRKDPLTVFVGDSKLAQQLKDARWADVAGLSVGVRELVVEMLRYKYLVDIRGRSAIDDYVQRQSIQKHGMKVRVG